MHRLLALTAVLSLTLACEGQLTVSDKSNDVRELEDVLTPDDELPGGEVDDDREPPDFEDDDDRDPPDFGDPGDEDDDPPGSDEDLCRTQGFWRNHTQLWPVADLVIGDTLYDADAVVELMDLPSYGDASLILVQQLVAAELNVEVGAPADILDTIDDAHAWFEVNAITIPAQVATSSPVGAEAVELSELLDAYNNQDCGQP